MWTVGKITKDMKLLQVAYTATHTICDFNKFYELFNEF